jgi:hypothetical protein
LVGAIHEKARIVKDGNVITAGGVTSGIDFGLSVVAEIAGEAVAQAIQLGIEYDPEPPFKCGHPDRAPDDVRRAVFPRYESPAATSKIFAPRSRRVDNTIRRNGRSAKATCREMTPARREETFGVKTITPMAVGRLAALVVVVLGLIRPTIAQQPSQAQINAIRQACRNDYQTYCASVPTGGSAALACLQQNAQSLSGQCQKAVSAVGGSAPSAEGQRPASPPAAPTPTAPASRTPPPPLSPRQEAMLLRRSCGPDYRAYCSDVPPGGGRIIACLEENGPSLSRQCRLALMSARQGR